MAADQYSSDAGYYGMPDMSNGDDWFANNPPPKPPPITDPKQAGYANPSNPQGLTTTTQSVKDFYKFQTGGEMDDATAAALISQYGNDWGALTAAIQANYPGAPVNSGLPNARTAATDDSGSGNNIPNLSGMLAPFTGTWAPVQAGPFSYRNAPTFKPFERPTLEQAQSEPGFDLAVKLGNQGIQNSAAGRGLLRSGGTLKDILQWNQNFGNMNYQNVYNRDLNTWNANTKGELDNWQQGLTGAKSIYDTDYVTQTQDPNANSWKNFLQQYDIFRSNQNDPYNKLADQQRVGLNATNG